MQAMLPSTSARSLLTDGMRALHRRENALAHTLLSEAVALDPRNEQAWLWLSGAVTTDAERIRCLRQVLALNPQHQAALQGLRMLDALPADVADATPIVPVPDPAFARDRFLLRQQIAVREKFQVWDEHNQPLLFIERPRHVLRNFVAFIAAAAFGVVMIFLFLAVAATATNLLAKIFGGVMVSVAFLFTVLAPFVIYQKRHTTIYRDESRREPLVQIMQDHKFRLITATYTINDAEGQMLARLHKNYLYDIFRKRWYCYGPDGRLLYVAKEDSLLRSFLRRAFNQLGYIGLIAAPLLRTNFVLLASDSTALLGVFNRKLTILDRYVLDLSADPQRTLDRRVALALGVMLDTGERR